MMPPPRLWVASMLADVNAESDQDLLALDPLLAQATVVEGGSGLGRGRQGQECLHGQDSSP
jgi:hypothetical protein